MGGRAVVVARSHLGRSFAPGGCHDELVSIAPRWIALQGAANARAVVPGALLRADNLQSLTAADVRVLVDEQALELVLDLRTDVEVHREGPGPLTAAPEVRIEHRSLHPDTGGATDLDATTISPWGDTEESAFAEETPVVRAYASYLLRRPDSIVAAIRGIAGAQGSVLIHCAAGKDRTGVVVALALDAAGVDRDVIVSDYLASRERIEQIVARLVGSETYRAELAGLDPQALAPVPGTMERFLEIVDAHFGGAAAWLQAQGLTDAELARLRERLGAS